MTQKDVLCKVFDILELGKPDMSEFDNRIKYQKIVYLLQASGISLGYGFNWYIKGPYSSPLAHDLFEIDDDIYEASKKIVFIDHDNIVSEMKKFQNKLGADIDNIIYLEILASLHYISKAYGKSGFNNLRNKLLEVKPNLREIDNIDEIIEKAHNNIKKFN